jgi:hypothetical protein
MSPRTAPRLGLLAVLLLSVLLVALWGCRRYPYPYEPYPAPPPPLAPLEVQYVAAYRLNVRAAPQPGTEILGVLQQGEPVEILGRSDNWLLVRRPPYYGRSWLPQGWVYGAYLTGYEELIPLPKSLKSKTAKAAAPAAAKTPPQEPRTGEPEDTGQSPAPTGVESGLEDAEG